MTNGKTQVSESPGETAVRRWLSLRVKIALAMGAVAGLVVTAILATNFHFRSSQLLQEFQAFVRGVAGTTALALNGEELASIRQSSDASALGFQHARKILDQARRINGLAEQELYILRSLPGADVSQTEFIVMLQRQSFIVITTPSLKPIVLNFSARGIRACRQARIFIAMRTAGGLVATHRSWITTATLLRSSKPTLRSAASLRNSVMNCCSRSRLGQARFASR